MTDIIPGIDSSSIDKIFEYDKFFAVLDFMDGAYENLYILSSQYDIVIVTIGSLKNLSKKAEWIREHLPFIEKVVLIYNEFNDMDKSAIDMSAGIILDDNQYNLWSSNAYTKYVFGEIYEYNQDFDGERLVTWADVYKRLAYVD